MESFDDRVPVTDEELTPEERERWNAACDRYEEVFWMNARQAVAALDGEERQRLWSRLVKDEASIVPSTAALEEALFAVTISVATGPSEKSGLFKRLLVGKEPLSFSPPRRREKAWYDLFERPGAHQVDVDGAHVRVEAGDVRDAHIMIYGDSWAVSGANGAGRDLLAAESAFRHRFMGGGDTQGSTQVDAAYLDEIRAIYLRGPEFVLSYPGCGDFILCLGWSMMMVTRKRGEALVEGFRDMDIDTVFDAEAFQDRYALRDVEAGLALARRKPEHAWLVECVEPIGNRANIAIMDHWCWKLAPRIDVSGTA